MFIGGISPLQAIGFLAILTAAAGLLAVNLWKGKNAWGLLAGLIAFFLLSRTVDRLVELFFHIQILSAFPLAGLPILIFALKARETFLIIFGSVFVLTVIPMILLQNRKPSVHARPRHQLGDKEMDRREIEQRERENELFRAMEETESGEE